MAQGIVCPTCAHRNRTTVRLVGDVQCAACGTWIVAPAQAADSRVSTMDDADYGVADGTVGDEARAVAEPAGAPGQWPQEFLQKPAIAGAGSGAERRPANLLRWVRRIVVAVLVAAGLVWFCSISPTAFGIFVALGIVSGLTVAITGAMRLARAMEDEGVSERLLGSCAIPAIVYCLVVRWQTMRGPFLLVLLGSALTGGSLPAAWLMAELGRMLGIGS